MWKIFPFFFFCDQLLMVAELKDKKTYDDVMSEYDDVLSKGVTKEYLASWIILQ